MLNAGELDQRITLQERVASEKPSGENAYTFADLATTPTVWARARPLQGREYVAAGAGQAELDVVFTIRHRSDVTVNMRVLWRGVPYDIVSPPADVRGQRDELELICKTGVRDGR